MHKGGHPAGDHACDCCPLTHCPAAASAAAANRSSTLPPAMMPVIPTSMTATAAAAAATIEMKAAKWSGTVCRRAGPSPHSYVPPSPLITLLLLLLYCPLSTFCSDDGGEPYSYDGSAAAAAAATMQMRGGCLPAETAPPCYLAVPAHTPSLPHC